MSPSKSVDIDFTTFYNVVDGKNISSKNVHNGINPATQEKLWDVPIATQQDVDDAVESALKAFKTWSQTPIEKRKETMNKFIDLYSGYQEEFTTLMCKETGKPKQFAQGEVAGVIDMFKHHTSLDIPTETFENDERSVTTTYVPLGVVGAICPWNFPLLLAIGKIAPAVLTGMY
jgi:acyl-CoA reductase-like NAD-dependent aldehyde dehydrogenase